VGALTSILCAVSICSEDESTLTYNIFSRIPSVFHPLAFDISSSLSGLNDPSVSRKRVGIPCFAASRVACMASWLFPVLLLPKTSVSLPALYPPPSNLSIALEPEPK